MTTASVIQILQERGLTAGQIALAAALIESRADGEDLIRSMIAGLETSKRPHELAAFVEGLCPILTRKPPRQDLRSDRANVRRECPPCGPNERWGHDGRITPRLPEKQWWPLRNSVVSDGEWTCHYCGEQNERMCADHVVPLSRGGTNERQNLVCCCIPCNSSKADRLLSEWQGRYR
jgi:5-methylcytosine-specific restriction endonuclease McrA